MQSHSPTPTRPFLTAAWRWLLMLNYECDPAVLQPYVPSGTVLDDWKGRHYLSVVGFLFRDTRVWGIPIPGHRNFEEVNLRFYVKRQDPQSGWRRGVVFVREIVPRWAICAVARGLYQEKYVACPMDHRLDPPDAVPSGTTSLTQGRVEYGWWWHGRRQHLAACFEGAPTPLTPGSEPEFITEHYWGYSALRNGRTKEYRVAHPPWQTWTATGATLVCDISAVYGPQFTPILRQPMTSAFVAVGSNIEVHPGVTL